MASLDKVALRELELVRKDMLRLARVVASQEQRMKVLEQWLITMDMTLKLSPENR